MMTTTTRATSLGRAILAVALGLPIGLVLGVHTPSKAICNVEPPTYFGPGNNTYYDYSDDDDDEENLWYGEGGADTLRSLPCKDFISGGADNDNVGGGSDADGVYGGAGSDYVYGGAQDDLLGGDDGRDRLYDAETGDVDWLSGGPNDDYVVDGRDIQGNDKVDGQGGYDNCEWDLGDTHPNCET